MSWWGCQIETTVLIVCLKCAPATFIIIVLWELFLRAFREKRKLSSFQTKLGIYYSIFEINFLHNFIYRRRIFDFMIFLRIDFINLILVQKLTKYSTWTLINCWKCFAFHLFFIYKIIIQIILANITVMSSELLCWVIVLEDLRTFLKL
jgi:hypothetical protein